MSETASSTDRRPEKDRQKSLGTSALLVSLTVAVALACIVFLSCTLTQTRVAALTIDGVTISLPKLDYVGRKWTANRDDSIKLQKLEEAKNAALVAEAIATKIAGSKSQHLEDKLAVFYYRIEKTNSELANEIKGKKTSEQYGRIVGIKADLIKTTEELGPLIAEVENAYDEWQSASDGSFAFSFESVKTAAEFQQFKSHVDQDASALFNYIKPDLDKDKVARARIENAIFELNIDKYNCNPQSPVPCGYIGGYTKRGLYQLLTLNPDLLTLLLVILMGVLGSTLQITHAYFLKNQVQTIGGYFQRITVGAMTALVIFIVAKAGVPIIADASRLGGDASINPYFVSFLAIVSGLLSENAIANVQAQGAKLFGPGGSGTDRWTRSDLTPELQTQNLSAAKLAEHLGVSEPDASAMLKGDAKIGPDKQQILAIYLRREPRDIFTDIPPPAKQQQQ
jgi:hypothetical protein